MLSHASTFHHVILLVITCKVSPSVSFIFSEFNRRRRRRTAASALEVLMNDDVSRLFYLIETTESVAFPGCNGTVSEGRNERKNANPSLTLLLSLHQGRCYRSLSGEISEPMRMQD